MLLLRAIYLVLWSQLVREHSFDIKRRQYPWIAKSNAPLTLPTKVEVLASNVDGALARGDAVADCWTARR